MLNHLEKLFGNVFYEILKNSQFDPVKLLTGVMSNLKNEMYEKHIGMNIPIVVLFTRRK